ncbi:AAA domain-containing protein [Haloactinopolyspora alba]|uniref:AAA domain-containing protein n=1 Tax=Haloactinopolyspora alba TaxID=648780 RepID=A0A2P8E3V7_9ACTN|nr:AAA family ATPase [Haloactinopolyspora alba]PSL04154.1 AAA domain-containing protein [Haloactinopolyspora alba]
MLNAQRALTRNVQGNAELPRVPELEPLYQHGARPRRGEVIMVAGRSGTQKSGFALFWTAMMGLPTLYMSADMSGFTASARLASIVTGHTTEQIERGMSDAAARQMYLDAIAPMKFQLCFDSPIRWTGLAQELDAYVELWDSYPAIVVLDNLMDIEGCESSYEAQMAAMAEVTDLARETGSTILILHHATDKGWEAKSSPWTPPSRDQVKGGLSEKPELSLSVALDPTSYAYNIAIIKQRMGRSDPSAQQFCTLRAYPEHTRFGPYKGTFNPPGVIDL